MNEKNPYAGVTVLVIEDESNTRLLIKRLLLQIGIISVLEAGDGKAVVLGALSLYLDFINMFQFLLQFMGERR